MNVLGLQGGCVTRHATATHMGCVAQARCPLHGRSARSLRSLVLDISGPLNDAAAAIVDDSFLRCFTSSLDEPWNWNLYLMPLWVLGVVVRNFILFPIRLALILLGFVVFMVSFAVVGTVLDGERRAHAERRLVQFLCQVFVASWTGVVKYHGPRPTALANRVWVANHSSMIDYCVLCAYSPFSVIMQLHPGWVGMVQKRYLNAMGCLWFNRTEARWNGFFLCVCWLGGCLVCGVVGREEKEGCCTGGVRCQHGLGAQRRERLLVFGIGRLMLYAGGCAGSVAGAHDRPDQPTVQLCRPRCCSIDAGRPRTVRW